MLEYLVDVELLSLTKVLLSFYQFPDGKVFFSGLFFYVYLEPQPQIYSLPMMYIIVHTRNAPFFVKSLRAESEKGTSNLLNHKKSKSNVNQSNLTHYNDDCMLMFHPQLVRYMNCCGENP